MHKLEVFDPPMCCSTGVCGPSVDPNLVRFAADLEWLKSKGVEINRCNLGTGTWCICPQHHAQERAQCAWHEVSPVARPRRADHCDWWLSEP